MVSSPAELLDECGGTTAVANHFDLPVSTVSSWKSRNSIPDDYRPGMIELAKAKRLKGIDYRWMTLIHANGGVQLMGQQ